MTQMATAGFSAFMQIRAGQASKEMYNAKASEAIIQGRAKAIQARQKALRVLQNLNETLAATTARAATGAGEVNTLSLTNYAMKEGATEYYTSKDNEALSIAQANYQAGIFKVAGKQAMLNAYAGAAGTLGQGHANQIAIGGYG